MEIKVESDSSLAFEFSPPLTSIGDQTDANMNVDSFQSPDGDRETTTETTSTDDVNEAQLKRELLTCPLCDFMATDKGMMKHHVDQVHSDTFRSSRSSNITDSKMNVKGRSKEYSCGECDYSASDRRMILRHQKDVHLKTRDFECSMCDYKSSQANNARRHMRSVHMRIKDFACSMCRYASSEKRNILRHMKLVHGVVKVLDCDKCDYQGTDHKSLKRHVSKFHKSKASNSHSASQSKTKDVTIAHRPDIASVTMVDETQSAYESDSPENRSKGFLQNAQEEDRFIKGDFPSSTNGDVDEDDDYINVTDVSSSSMNDCNDLSSATVRKDVIEASKRRTSATPSREAVQKQVDTGKTQVHVPTDKELNEHYLIGDGHSGKRVFACKECRYKSSVPSNLRRHIKSVHLKVKNFSCPLCEYTSYEKRRIFLHMRAIHGEAREQPCADCPFKATDQNMLSQHMSKVHSIECSSRCSEDASMSNEENIEQNASRKESIPLIQCKAEAEDVLEQQEDEEAVSLRDITNSIRDLDEIIMQHEEESLKEDNSETSSSLENMTPDYERVMSDGEYCVTLFTSESKTSDNELELQRINKAPISQEDSSRYLTECNIPLFEDVANMKAEPYPMSELIAPNNEVVMYSAKGEHVNKQEAIDIKPAIKAMNMNLVSASNGKIAKEFSCSDCSYKSGSKRNVERHMKAIHWKLKDFPCSHCEYKASEKGHLKRHIKMVHMKVKEFACSKCEYKSTENGNITRHMQVVHGEIACPKCDYRASEKVHMILHMRSEHATKKPFSCSECAFEAPDRESVFSHVKSVHGSMSRFSCCRCAYTTTEKADYVSHSYSAHGNVSGFSCWKCDFTANKMRTVFSHMNAAHGNAQTMNFKCFWCEFRASDKNSVLRHIQVEHGNAKATQCVKSENKVMKEQTLLIPGTTALKVQGTFGSHGTTTFVPAAQIKVEPGADLAKPIKCVGVASSSIVSSSIASARIVSSSITSSRNVSSSIAPSITSIPSSSITSSTIASSNIASSSMIKREIADHTQGIASIALANSFKCSECDFHAPSELRLGIHLGAVHNYGN